MTRRVRDRQGARRADIHDLCARRKGPFVAVNGAAIVETRLLRHVETLDGSDLTNWRRVTRPGRLDVSRGIPEPFDHPAFIFEPKLDGFRALAVVQGHRCELVSRNGQVFKSWPQLAEEIAHSVRARDVVLDGEICCLEPDGRSKLEPASLSARLAALLRLRRLGGRRLRRPGITADRSKAAARRHPAGRRIPPPVSGPLRRTEARLFRVACERDLEGIVAKWGDGTYQSGRGTSLLKIKNPEYSQMEGRREMFEA